MNRISTQQDWFDQLQPEGLPDSCPTHFFNKK